MSMINVGVQVLESLLKNCDRRIQGVIVADKELLGALSRLLDPSSETTRANRDRTLALIQARSTSPSTAPSMLFPFLYSCTPATLLHLFTTSLIHYFIHSYLT